MGTEAIEVDDEDVTMMVIIINSCFHLLSCSPSDNVLCIKILDVALCEEMITILFLQRKNRIHQYVYIYFLIQYFHDDLDSLFTPPAQHPLCLGGPIFSPSICMALYIGYSRSVHLHDCLLSNLNSLPMLLCFSIF